MTTSSAPDFGDIARHLTELGRLAEQTVENLRNGHGDPKQLQLFLDTAREALKGAALLDLLREADRERQENETFLRIGMQLSSTLDIDELLKTIIEALRDVVDYSAAGIFLVNRKTNQIEADFLIGYEKADRRKLREKFEEGVPVGAGLVGWVVQNGEAIVVSNVHEDSRYIAARDATRSEIAVPIMSSGEMVGCLNLESDEVDGFTSGDLEPLRTFASLVAVTLDRAHFHREMLVKRRMEEELSVARRIQLSFLPTSMPRFTPYDLAGLNFPTLEVGGDYYDFIRITDTDLGIAIGDVAGKGIGAALLMASFRASLRLESQSNYAISTILQKVNRFLYETNPPEQFVTAFYGVIDRSNNVLTYSNAGHNPPLIIRNDDVIPLDIGGLILGSFPYPEYEETRVNLFPEDILVLYTDGVPEARNDDGEEFGTERLADVIRTYRELGAMDMVRRICREVHHFQSDKFPQDDLTVSIVKCQ